MQSALKVVSKTISMKFHDFFFFFTVRKKKSSGLENKCCQLLSLLLASHYIFMFLCRKSPNSKQVNKMLLFFKRIVYFPYSCLCFRFTFKVIRVSVPSHARAIDAGIDWLWQVRDSRLFYGNKFKCTRALHEYDQLMSPSRTISTINKTEQFKEGTFTSEIFSK